MERINIRVEGSVKQRLEADAKQNGTSPSAIVRQLIEEHYRQPVVENCLQLASSPNASASSARSRACRPI